MESKTRSGLDNFAISGIFLSHFERQQPPSPSVIVIGGGISGIAAARALSNASFKVILLESRNRLGGRVHTDYSFGCPIDMGASWLHGVCNENPLAPFIRGLGLRLYRTSGDNSVLYDHDLESYALFDMDGHQIPQQLVIKVGEIFERILKETEKVRDEYAEDMSLLQAISIVLDRNPQLRQEGLAYEVLQWYICRMEAWFAADVDSISLKSWDQEHVLSGGHGLMVQGYYPVVKALAKDLDIRLNHRVTKIIQCYNKVMITMEDGTNFVADAAIITVPLGVLKANMIEFDPKLPEWKVSAISDLGVGNENKIALHFSTAFWPNVEVLGTVAPTSYACGYFLNLHKATGHPVLVYMAAGRFAYDIEKLSDEEAVNFVMLQLKKMLPDATEPVQYLVSRWGTDPDSLGSYSCDLVGKPADLYERFRAPIDNLYFAGEAASVDHSGSVHGAYTSGIVAAEECRRRLLLQHGISDLFQIVLREDISKMLADTVNRGKLVSDEIIINLLSKRLENGEAKGESGFILDGFPRTIRQAEILEGVTDIDLVVNLKLREDVLLAKCLGRRICTQCGKNFNVASINIKGENGRPGMFMAPLPPPAQCMSKLVTRADDTEEVVKERLRIYHETSEPVEEFYRCRGKLLEFDLPGGIPESWPKLLQVLNLEDHEDKQSAAA